MTIAFPVKRSHLDFLILSTLFDSVYTVVDVVRYPRIEEDLDSATVSKIFPQKSR